MKRVIALIMVCILLLCFSACDASSNDEQSNQNASNAAAQNTTGMEDTVPSTQETEGDKYNISAEDVVDWVKHYDYSVFVNGMPGDFSLFPVLDMETEKGEREGQKYIRFNGMHRFVRVSISETNGIVDYVSSICFPSHIASSDIVYYVSSMCSPYHIASSDDSELLAEAAADAYAFAMVPLYACEPGLDRDWHKKAYSDAPDEDFRIYTSDTWLYRVRISEHSVTCAAHRYCSSCKSNAPNVTFFSGKATCDSCNSTG